MNYIYGRPSLIAFLPPLGLPRSAEVKFWTGNIAYRRFWRYHSTNYQRRADAKKVLDSSPLSTVSSFSPILIVLPLICAFERPLRCTLCVTISGDFFCVKSTHNALSLFESSTNPLIGPLHAGLHPAQLSHWLENEAGLILIHVCFGLLCYQPENSGMILSYRVEHRLR